MSAGSAISLLHIGKLVMPHRQSLCLVRTLAPGHAIVRASLPVSPGSRVTLGLRNAIAIATQVESVQGERIMLVFRLPLAMERLVEEQARGRSGTESVRLAVAGQASIETQGRTILLPLRDLSLFGAQVSDPTGALIPDALITIYIAGLARRQASVCWHRNGRAGLRFAFSLGYELLDTWLAVQASGQYQPRFAARRSD